MRVAIIGNSGSGKSTLAGWRASGSDAPVLDFDTVAWQPEQPGLRRDETAAEAELRALCSAHPRWIVEGWYAGLVTATFRWQPTLLFVNPGLAACIANCCARPWEPHKYPSKQAQEERLEFLLAWVADYYERGGEMSLAGHLACFAAYPGAKLELKSLVDLRNPPPGLQALHSSAD